jgi:hypothetical protein
VARSGRVASRRRIRVLPSLRERGRDVQGLCRILLTVLRSVMPRCPQQRCDRPRGGGCHGWPGGGPGDDAGGQCSSAGRLSRVQANDMCGEMREHVGIPDGSELLSEPGANGFAVVVAGGDVAGYPSPLPVREGAV